jgi:hypothetical protein
MHSLKQVENVRHTSTPTAPDGPSLSVAPRASSKFRIDGCILYPNFSLSMHR